MRKFEVFHKGKRYWATPGRFNGKPTLWFWSSHKWPFYHGHYTPDDREDCWQHFIAWLPFKGDGECKLSR